MEPSVAPHRRRTGGGVPLGLGAHVVGTPGPRRVVGAGPRRRCVGLPRLLRPRRLAQPRGVGRAAGLGVRADQRGGRAPHRAAVERASPAPARRPPTPHTPTRDDLDLFGRASLFSLLGSAGPRPAGQALARWLLHPARPEEIRERQRQLRELAGREAWREMLAATARMVEANPHELDVFLVGGLLRGSRRSVGCWLDRAGRHRHHCRWRSSPGLVPSVPRAGWRRCWCRWVLMAVAGADPQTYLAAFRVRLFQAAAVRAPCRGGVPRRSSAVSPTGCRPRG